MRKRAAAILCLFSAVLGAAAMLVFLEARHGYGMKQAERVAEMEEIQINTGMPVPPTDEEVARARQACESLSRVFGMSMGELGLAGYYVRIGPNRVADRDALAASFGHVDRLRMTLTGLSRRDVHLARNQVNRDLDAELRQRQLAGRLRATLWECSQFEPPIQRSARR